MFTKQDLTPFCGKKPYRYRTGAPFVIEGKVYATDGRIAVRVPTLRFRFGGYGKGLLLPLSQPATD